MTELKTINEEVEFGTISANNADPNIMSGDKNVLGRIFQQCNLSSLPRDIFAFLQMGSSSGGVFAMRTKNDDTGIEVIRQNISCEIKDPIKTSITQEAYHDILNMYGEHAFENIAKMFKAETNAQENQKCLAFLKENAHEETALTLASDANTNFYNLNEKISECILKVNYKHIRTFKSWAVVPYKLMAHVLAKSIDVNGAQTGLCSLHLARIGLTDFYLNPDIDDTNVYVGVNDPETPSKSSAFFGEYVADVTSTLDPVDGSFKFYIFNRFGICVNPLHNSESPMLYKFNVSLA